MITVDRVIAELKNRQNEHARVALSEPEGTDFKYGKAVGTFLAYEDMLAHIEEMIEKAAKADREEEDS